MMASNTKEMNTTVKELEVLVKYLPLLFFVYNLLFLNPNILPLFDSYKHTKDMDAMSLLLKAKQLCLCCLQKHLFPLIQTFVLLR